MRAILLIVVAAALLLIVFALRSPDPVAPANDVQPGLHPSAATRGDSSPETSGERPAEVAESRDCLTRAELEEMPWLSEDLARFEPVSTGGDDVATFRNLDGGAVRGLAEQGDSAAMAVLGAMAYMRAVGLSESQAVPFLLGELGDHFDMDRSNLLQPGGQMQLIEAGSWFYQSALHGRLTALGLFAIMLQEQNRDAVNLGWISQQAFDALPEEDQRLLAPEQVYMALLFDIAPQLMGGTFGSGLYEQIESNDWQLAIRQSLLVEFYRNVDQAGLQPISVPDATTPDVDEIRAMQCEGE